MGEVLSFTSLGFFLSQVIDDECGLHGWRDERVTSVPHGFQRLVVWVGAVSFFRELFIDPAQDFAEVSEKSLVDGLGVLDATKKLNLVRG